LDLLAVTDFTREARELLRDETAFQWTTIPLIAFAAYVYAVEVERGRIDIVLAGLALWAMDWFNELVNSAVLGISDRAALWTVTGDTSYLILIGLTIEISIFFLVLGPIFVKYLPADPKLKILGIPNRVFMVALFSAASAGVEVLLHASGYFHWEYWWWNTASLPVIALLGYATFYAVAAWVYDMGDNRRKQLTVLGTLVAVDLALGVAFGIAGWL
jgi:hypothetical protein